MIIGKPGKTKATFEKTSVMINHTTNGELTRQRTTGIWGSYVVTVLEID